VLLIEQNRLLRETMSAIIGKQSDLKLVALSANFDNVESKVQRLKPHVVLLDYYASWRDASRTLEAINRVAQKAKVVLSGCSLVAAPGGE
jgi:chemotaxis response regulator CheB